MKEIIKLTLALGIVCLVAASVLSFAYYKTIDRQEEAAQEERTRAIRKVLPDYTNKPLKDKVTATHKNTTVTFFRALKNGKLVGVAARGVTDKGYGGRIKLLIGLTPEGNIREIVTTQHQETPGLGTKALERKASKTIGDVLSEEQGNSKKSSLPPNTYLDQYKKYNVADDVGDFKLKKKGGEIDAVSGATITSNAVADAVSKVSRVFAHNRQKIVKGTEK